MAMNVYFVLSEMLEVTIPILDDGTGPTESYAICEMVATTSRSRAKWMAWKSDKDGFNGDFQDMPRFTVRVIAKGVEGVETLLPHNSPYWDALETLDYEQPAPKPRRVPA